MERYYAVPIENGLYAVPGIDVIRSTSFYGFRSFALFSNMASTMILHLPKLRLRSSKMSICRGGHPEHSAEQRHRRNPALPASGAQALGLTNLRTVQDWIVRRRFRQVHGIVSVNSWGGPTKQFDVDVDPHKLQVYGVSIPQIVTALGNANINVGGREITIGQQSINIRGIGLIDDGGNDDLTQGYKVNDIQKVVITQSDRLPIRVRDVAKVSVGFVPRLGVAGKEGMTISSLGSW